MVPASRPFRLAVKAVIFDDWNRCLLIRRSTANRNFAGCWEWPGGKLDPGEDFATGLAREVREECGLQVELTGLAGATEFAMPAVNVILLCLEARLSDAELKRLEPAAKLANEDYVRSATLKAILKLGYRIESPP